MSGQKGRSGGVRPGSGPYRRRLYLAADTAQILRVLLLHQRDVFNNPCLSEEQVVSALIRAAWQELDEHFQELSKQA